jgi:hypothetical protein
MADQPNNLIAADDPALDEVKFIQREPILASQPPGTAPSVNDPFQGAIISQIGLQTDTADSQLAGHLPIYRLMPSSVAGSATAVSAATSTLLKNPEFVTAQAQIEQNTVAIANIQTQNIFLGAWSATTAYVAGNQVTEAGGYYICILANINQMPPNVTYWQLVSTTNTTVFLGAYNGATAYVPGNQVTYQGSYWICIANSTGNAPSTTSTFWTLVGTSVILIGAWNSGTAYVQGNEVTFSGNVYQCILANTNQTPPNVTYWLLIGPASLDNVPDGTTRFAATGSTLSYVPTSNPLTASAGVSNATITVLSFTMRTSSKGDISITGSSITLLSYSTLYYIYYDDPTLAGGSVTFVPTTTKATAIQGAGRFFVGSIVTPAATAPNTTGKNDGGVGAQGGSTSVFLFGAFTNTGATIDPTLSNPQNAFDGDLTTFASVVQTNSASTTVNGGMILQAATPTSAPWSSLILYVLTSVTGTSGVHNSATVDISLDGGNSYTTLFTVTDSNRAQTTDQMTLSNNQNLALVRVRCRTAGDGVATGAVTLNIYEAYVEGII